MERIKLRAITSTDFEKTLLWHNQEDISDLYSGHPFPVNIEMEQKWYQEILFSNLPVTVFGIDYIEKSQLIGIAVLKDINLINRSSEFAIYIGDKEFRGKGLSLEATLETLRFGFFKLGLHRIYLKVLEENEIAVKLYKTAGFVKEGLCRNSVFKNNKYKNELIMAILKEEFHG
jgi:RimJ/RimL family protein N-acetyltransferase